MYTVGQDRSVAVTKLETGTKVRIVMIGDNIIMMSFSGLQSALLRRVCVRCGE